MAMIETFRMRARQIVRWHREGNYSVGRKVRQIERFRDLKDAEVLAMPLPLAPEVVAAEAGFTDRAALNASLDGISAGALSAEPGLAQLEHVIPAPVRARRCLGCGVLCREARLLPRFPSRQPAVLRRRLARCGVPPFAACP
jgi:hypothetical protein